jgi:membrane-associated phospholipid phosphatase
LDYFSLAKGTDSMPSGHTAIAFTLFITLARFVKKGWFTLLCLLPPIIIGISRLILADHYVSDIIVSAYVGTISVFWGEWILQRFFSAWLKPKTHAE